MADVLIKMPVVLGITGGSRSGTYGLIAQGKFPKPVKLEGTRSSAWVRSEVEEWVAQQIARRDKQFKLSASLIRENNEGDSDE